MSEMKFFNRYFDMLGWGAPLRGLVMSRLGDSARAYHGLGHHAIMLRGLDPESPHYLDLIAATMFHDIIYDPQRGDNEERSAELAERRLRRTGHDLDFINCAIVETKAHLLGRGDDVRERAVENMLRADLMILWTNNAPRYRWYANGVRTEYAHVPNPAYNAGREAVLNDLMGKISPHVSDSERLSMEANIAWEQAALMQGRFNR